MTQDDLARAIGVKSQSVYRYEAGTYEPELLPLVKIALAARGQDQEALLDVLPGELRTLAAIFVERVCDSRRLDRPAIILESLRAGLAASPPSPADIETSAVKRQTTRAQEIFANEDKSPQRQQRKRKRRRTKVA